jgi:dTDP-4-dehydrorhamnose 3,5-epimerase
MATELLSRLGAAAPGGLAGDLAVPDCEPGIGTVVCKIDSPDLIAGVRVAGVALWPDDRGYFLEVLRSGRGLVEGFGADELQVSAALSYPGTIKAFHYHQLQSDCWTVPVGSLQVVLVDLRRQSPTYARKNTMYVGAARPWQLLIPPGVAHGYKVIGTDAALMVYATDRIYNPLDEGRISFNDAQIAYDWEIQHK